MAHVTAIRRETMKATGDDRRPLRIWLGIVVLALFALVMVGGATRLTQSGLSITEWKPIHGVVPPLNDQQWQEEFDLYKRIPQYQKMNSDMTIEGFKSIFWWEWAHRLLARSIGILFFIPFGPDGTDQRQPIPTGGSSCHGVSDLLIHHLDHARSCSPLIR
jgi:heme a synthase